MLIKDVLSKSTEFLKSKGIETGRLDSELLLSNALGLKRLDLYLKYEQPLNEEEVVRCREVIARRGKGEPVAYILKEKEFFNISLYVDNRVLVPRPETETLVEIVLNKTKELPEELRFIDIGAGSGAIGLSIAKANKCFIVDLVEKDKLAFEVCTLNIKKLNLDGQCFAFNSDIETFRSTNKYDFVVGNPPYISVNDPMVQKSVHLFEPHSALYSNDEGLSDLKNWIRWSIEALNSNGFFIFEIGMSQGDAILTFANSLGQFNHVQIYPDLSGRPRFIGGIKNG